MNKKVSNKTDKYNDILSQEIIDEMRKIRAKSEKENPRTITFDSDKKPSFPGYKANYWI